MNIYHVVGTIPGPLGKIGGVNFNVKAATKTEARKKAKALYPGLHILTIDLD